jgi:hypothetical protein
MAAFCIQVLMWNAGVTSQKGEVTPEIRESTIKEFQAYQQSLSPQFALSCARSHLAVLIQSGDLKLGIDELISDSSIQQRRKLRPIEKIHMLEQALSQRA